MEVSMRKFLLLITLGATLWATKYPVFLNGKKVGWEDVKFSGNCMTSEGNYRFIPMNFKMKICYQGSLPSYFSFSGTVRGVLQRIVARRKGDSLRGMITAGTTSLPLSVKIKGPTLLLPNGPLSPYLMAYRVIRKEKLTSASAYIIPQTFLEASIESGQTVSINIAGLIIKVGEDFVLVPAQNFSLGKEKGKVSGREIKIQGVKPGLEVVSRKGRCLRIKREQATAVAGVMEYCPGKFTFRGTLYAGLYPYRADFSVKKEDFPFFVHLNPFLSLPILKEEWGKIPEKFRILMPPSYFYPHPYTVSAELIPVASNLYYLKISTSQGFFIKTEKGIPVAMADPFNDVFVNPGRVPLKPPSYRPIKGEEVKIDGLCGTLLVPEKPGAGVIFISGSGPQDRNENSPGKWGLKTYLFARMADYLYRKGIASLRTDDRGVGCSSSRKPSLEGMVEDVVSQVDFLRKRLPGGKIYLIGHSLGTLLALMASSRVKVEGLVLLGAYSGKGRDLVMYQMKYAVKDADRGFREAALKEEERLLSALCSGNLSLRDRKILATPYLDYLKEFMGADPLNFVHNFAKRVLIINGDRDRQTPPSSAEALARALQREGKQVRFKTIPADHLFLPSPTGEVSLYGLLIYTRKVPSEQLYEEVSLWLLRNSEKGKED